MPLSATNLYVCLSVSAAELDEFFSHAGNASTSKQAKQDTPRALRFSTVSKQPHHADWIVTLAFYKALHAVDSYSAKLQIHPRGHLERNRYVRELLDEIFMQYDALYNASRVARYEAVTYQDDPEDVMMLVSSSRNIEDYINSLLETH